jgi:hypothetical protein
VARRGGFFRMVELYGRESGEFVVNGNMAGF